jgi:hypothetical protein
VNPTSIVKRFDGFEHTQSCLFEILKRFMLGPLVFQGPEESFHHRIVVTVASAAHRTLNAERSQGLLISIARVLTATVAVML